MGPDGAPPSRLPRSTAVARHSPPPPRAHTPCHGRAPTRPRSSGGRRHMVTGVAGVISCCSLGFEAIAALSSVYMQQQHVANVYNSEIHRLENKMICVSKTRTFG